MKVAKIPLFDFVSQGQHLSVTEGTIITDPLVPCSTSQLFEKYQKPGQSKPIICGMIPFDPRAPSFLIHSTTFSLKPYAPLPHTSLALRIKRAENALQESPDNQQKALAYRNSVSQALEDIEQGLYQKIVLAWEKTFKISLELVKQNLFDRLVFPQLYQANPRADLFRVSLAPHHTWLGASPEVISDLHSGSFSTHPLAGSLPRTGACTATQAEQFLFSSGKDLREHKFVVDHIVRRLQQLPGLDLISPQAPSITATDSMWHLGTHIKAQVPIGLGSLELAASIHPTPAVCGSPLEASQVRIKELEACPRTFFSGLVGWTDSQGNGRWSLVLRCLERVGHEVKVYAGAGIVAGSEPERELSETQAKMHTVLKAIETSLRQ